MFSFDSDKTPRQHWTKTANAEFFVMFELLCITATMSERTNTTASFSNDTKKERLGFSIHETADALGISYISVIRLVQRGKLKSVRALKTRIIPRAEIERFLSETA